MFLQSGYMVLIEDWRDRGTSWIGTAILSPDTKLIAGTGAVSREDVDRSQLTVKVYCIIKVCNCGSPGNATGRVQA